MLFCRQYDINIICRADDNGTQDIILLFATNSHGRYCVIIKQNVVMYSNKKKNITHSVITGQIKCCCCIAMVSIRVCSTK